MKRPNKSIQTQTQIGRGEGGIQLYSFLITDLNTGTI